MQRHESQRNRFNILIIILGTLHSNCVIPPKNSQEPLKWPYLFNYSSQIHKSGAPMKVLCVTDLSSMRKNTFESCVALYCTKNPCDDDSWDSTIYVLWHLSTLICLMFTVIFVIPSRTYTILWSHTIMMPWAFCIVQCMHTGLGSMYHIRSYANKGRPVWFRVIHLRIRAVHLCHDTYRYWLTKVYKILSKIDDCSPKAYYL